MHICVYASLSVYAAVLSEFVYVRGVFDSFILWLQLQLVDMQEQEGSEIYLGFYLS